MVKSLFKLFNTSKSSTLKLDFSSRINFMPYFSSPFKVRKGSIEDKVNKNISSPSCPTSSKAPWAEILAAKKVSAVESDGEGISNEVI
jgi:hypothetical protein